MTFKFRRPPRKSEKVAFLLTENDALALMEVASKQEQTLSEFCRRAVKRIIEDKQAQQEEVSNV